MTILKYFSTFLLILTLAWHFEIGLNTTPSLPRGLYQTDDSRPPQRGDIVKFCLDNESSKATNAEFYVGLGQCPNGLKPLLKYVVGLEGDVVTVEDKMVYVKHKDKDVSIAMHIKEVDSHGEKVNSFVTSGIIPQGKAFVYSYNEGSFDSRYFGLVNENELTNMKEVLIF